MKRVLFILPSLTVGGLERVQVTIANKLVRNNFDVTVMTLNPADDLKDELDERVRFVYKPAKKLVGKRIPYIRYKLYDDGMWETRASAKQLYRYYVGDEEYDVEIAFFRGLPVKIVSGSTNKNAAHLAWVHSDFRNAGGYKNQFRSINDVKLAYSGFKKVVCVSNEAREGFIEALCDTGNLTTIYNMIPVEKIMQLSKETLQFDRLTPGLNLVMVGRLLDHVKGHTRLIRAVSRLQDEGYSVFLTIVGDGIDKKRIHQCISEHRAYDYVFMLGNKKNPYPYIANADILVCASVFEGFPLNVAEAIVLGTPVLSTYCTGPNEILDYGKYGMIVENSEEGLYNGLRRIVEDPSILKEYKKKAFQRQNFFDENKILKQITDLF